jgi:hypothetical protein
LILDVSMSVAEATTQFILRFAVRTHHDASAFGGFSGPPHHLLTVWRSLRRCSESVRWLGTNTLRASIPLPGTDRMEVFALVTWMLVGDDFQEIRWMSEAE